MIDYHPLDFKKLLTKFQGFVFFSRLVEKLKVEYS